MPIKAILHQVKTLNALFNSLSKRYRQAVLLVVTHL